MSMAEKTNDDLSKQFTEHEASDAQHFHTINKKLDKINAKLDPLVEQDQRVTWAAQRVLTLLKWLLLGLSIIAAAVAIIKGVK